MVEIVSIVATILPGIVYGLAGYLKNKRSGDEFRPLHFLKTQVIWFLTALGLASGIPVPLGGDPISQLGYANFLSYGLDKTVNALQKKESED